MLVVLDGFGLGAGDEGDATVQAHAPFFERARRELPMAKLETSGEAVGLPPGQMGNSEVGHMTLGAGRVIDQDITRISKALAEGDLERNPALGDLLDAVGETGGRVHLMGLVSDGGVHSHIDHLVLLLEHMAERDVEPVVHVFLDGRDTPPRSGLGFVKQLLPHVEAAGGRVATVMGRYWAMDRDTRWDRTARAYHAIVCGEGLEAPDPVAAVQAGYDRDEGDEFVQPTVIAGAPPLRDGDGVLHFNFRADRARQLTNALTDACPELFEGQLERAKTVRLARYVCFTEYDARFDLPVAFPGEVPERILGELLAEAGRRQLRVAETEKYAHVTFFFNGGREEPFPGEERVLVPSPREVPTYDLEPEMSAEAVTEAVLEGLEDDYAFVLVNYANPDMVGHTGVMPAAVKAVETVDRCLARVCEALLARGGTALVTADHGNCECMIDATDGGPHTAHTTNPVPLWWVTTDPGGRRLRDGGLADIAPTVLELLDLPVPEAMTGRCLIERSG